MNEHLARRATDRVKRIERLEAEHERLRKHAKLMSDALLELRPLGGSEMFTRVGEEFYADPDYCTRLIREMRQELHELRVAEVRRSAVAPVMVALTLNAEVEQSGD
jgi:hypothetical protein